MREPTEIEDRVARACNYPPCTDAEWDELKRVHSHLYQSWVAVAAKHMRAMRTPTATMLATTAPLVDVRMCTDADRRLIHSAISEIAGSAPDNLEQGISVIMDVLRDWEMMIDTASPTTDEG